MVGRKRLDSREWWEKQIKELIESKPSLTNTPVRADKLYDILGKSLQSVDLDKDVVYEKDLWTLKKLIIYKYYIDIYTKIIHRYYQNYYYFDLFSGSGLVKIKEGNIIVFGSALLSILTPQTLFTKYIFVDVDEIKINALTLLLEEIKKSIPSLDYEIINDDMNNIDKYANFLEECEHALVTIDPEGMEPKWGTIKKISSYKCDIIITFMSSGIQRVLGRTDKGVMNKLKDFCGVNDIDRLKNIQIEDLKQLYIDQIKRIGKEVHTTVPVSAKNFEYDIIVATKKTQGNNPWLKAIDSLKQKLDIDDKALKSIIEQLQGRQTPLV